jgi:hypothetical protein
MIGFYAGEHNYKESIKHRYRGLAIRLIRKEILIIGLLVGSERSLLADSEGNALTANSVFDSEETHMESSISDSEENTDYKLDIWIGI